MIDPRRRTTHHNRFTIRNALAGPAIVNIEPECVRVELPPGEEMTVRDTYDEAPVTLKLESDRGETVLSIWPGDGDVRVEKDGVDVFEIVEQQAVR